MQREVVGRWRSGLADGEGSVLHDWEASWISSREGAGPYLLGHRD